jgi:DNA ligase (NAD+)
LTELDLREVELFGKKRAAQVYEEIQGTLHTTDEKLLAAFGIPNVAKEIAIELVRHFGGIHGVLTAPYKELIEVEGIGMIVGSYIRGHQHECTKLFLDLKEMGLTLEERKTGALTGKVFCITGKLPMKRDAIVRMIEDKGGVWKNAVTKRTDYLVTDNPGSGSSKNKKAQQYGTKIISFIELQELVND